MAVISADIINDLSLRNESSAHYHPLLSLFFCFICAVQLFLACIQDAKPARDLLPLLGLQLAALLLTNCPILIQLPPSNQLLVFGIAYCVSEISVVSIDGDRNNISPPQRRYQRGTMCQHAYSIIIYGVLQLNSQVYYLLPRASYTLIMHLVALLKRLT